MIYLVNLVLYLLWYLMSDSVIKVIVVMCEYSEHTTMLLPVAQPPSNSCICLLLILSAWLSNLLAFAAGASITMAALSQKRH